PSDVPAGVVVTDAAPAGTTISCSGARRSTSPLRDSSTAVCATDLGASTTFSVTLAVSSGYLAADVTNSASISSSPTADPTPGNKIGRASCRERVNTALSAAKDDEHTRVTAGTSTNYAVTVTNNAPS